MTVQKTSVLDFFKGKVNRAARFLKEQTPIFIANAKNWLKKPDNRKKLLKWGFLTGLAGVLMLVLLAALVYLGAFGKLPTYADLKAIRNHNASVVYAGDKVILGKYYIQNRVNASMEEIPPAVIQALVATEDARFFEHRGIDLRAWMRVLVKSILLMDDSAGGGSTLSQQLAKNLFPRKRYWLFSTLLNKMRETYTARRLERTYTKEELLHLYLNTVPFGENIYGIKVAAQRYFGTTPKRLRTEDAAVLVGMLKGNTLYNPARHPENALKRRNVVLGQMVKYGYLSQEECDSLRQLPLQVRYFKEGHNEGLATYFREHLRLELEEILKDYKKPDGSAYNLYTDGLKIYTTINSRMQRYAEEAVQEHMPKLQQQFYENWKGRAVPWEEEKVLENAMKRSARYKMLKAEGLSEAKIKAIFETPITMRVFNWENGEEEREMSPLDSIRYYLSMLNTGFLAMDAQNGSVLAWVGGIDYQFFQYDHAKARRQVGSTFKPIVYATALQNGMLPCEYTSNEQVVYSQYRNWSPRNANGEYGGVYSMEGALSQSVNAVSVEIIMRAGIDSVKQLARAMGIEGTIPREPSIALGTADAALSEMVQVYGTFANRGRRTYLHYLDRIETADGKVLVKFKKPGVGPQLLSTDHADMMIKMMQAVVDSGTARRLRYEFGLGNAIAGKTGTTQNNSDGWFLGFTPKVVAGAWVGAETPQVHFRSTRIGQGGYSALPIWGRFMRKVNNDSALKSYRWGQFTPPPDSILALMQCPHFLPAMPVFVNDMGQDSLNFFQRLFNVFRKEDVPIQQEASLESDNLPRRRRNETEEEYAARLKKIELRKQEQQEQEKLKEFWGKKLFGKEKKEGGEY